MVEPPFLLDLLGPCGCGEAPEAAAVEDEDEEEVADAELTEEEEVAETKSGFAMGGG